MPGASIAFDQVQNSVLTQGTPGVSRRDIRAGVPVTLRSAEPGNQTQRWTLLDAPTGSSAAIANADAASTTFTPDVGQGTYRVALDTVAPDGSTARQVRLVAAMLDGSTGLALGRGNRRPAYYEQPEEANWAANARGYAPDLEGMISDHEAALAALAAADVGVHPGIFAQRLVVPIFHGEASTILASTLPYVATVFRWDPALYVPTGAANVSILLKAIARTTNAANAAVIDLYRATGGTPGQVAASVLSTNSTAEAEVSADLTSALLTASAGLFRLRFGMNPVDITQLVTLYNARLAISWS